MLNFDVLEKGLGIVSPPHFVYDLSSRRATLPYFYGFPYFLKVVINVRFFHSFLSAHFHHDL